MKTLKFKINDKVYEMPSCWEDCTFGQYVDLLSYNETQSKSITKRIIHTVSILTSDDSLKKILFEEADRESILALGELILWTVKEPDISKFKMFKEDQVIEIEGGLKYKLKANYNSNLTNWDMVHIEELKANEKFNYSIWELVFGVLFRKLDEQGNEILLSPNVIIETIESFRNKIKMDTVYSVLYFFLNGGQTSSTEDSKSYSNRKIIIQILKDQENKTKKRKKKQ